MINLIGEVSYNVFYWTWIMIAFQGFKYKKHIYIFGKCNAKHINIHKKLKG